MDLSIVVVSYNTASLLADCLRALPTAAAGTEHEVVVVDNASNDCSADKVAHEFPEARIIRNAENAGFARANLMDH